MNEFIEEKKIAEDLNSSQSWMALILCSFFGSIPALAATYFLLGERVFLIMWVIPGLAAGLFVRFGAQIYRFKMRVVSALILFVLMSTMGVILHASPMIYALAFTNSAVLILISKRSLSKQQEKALWLEKQGKFNI